MIDTEPFTIESYQLAVAAVEIIEKGVDQIKLCGVEVWGDDGESFSYSVEFKSHQFSHWIEEKNWNGYGYSKATHFKHESSVERSEIMERTNRYIAAGFTVNMLILEADKIEKTNSTLVDDVVAMQRKIEAGDYTDVKDGDLFCVHGDRKRAPNIFKMTNGKAIPIEDIPFSER